MEILLHEESDMNSAQSKNKTRSERLIEDEAASSSDNSKKPNSESKSE